MLLLPSARTGGKALLDAAKEIVKQSEQDESEIEALNATMAKIHAILDTVQSADPDSPANSVQSFEVCIATYPQLLRNIKSLGKPEKQALAARHFENIKGGLLSVSRLALLLDEKSLSKQWTDCVSDRASWQHSKPDMLDSLLGRHMSLLEMWKSLDGVEILDRIQAGDLLKGRLWDDRDDRAMLHKLLPSFTFRIAMLSLMQACSKLHSCLATIDKNVQSDAKKVVGCGSI